MFFPRGSESGDLLRKEYGVDERDPGASEAWHEVSASLRAGHVNASVLIEANDTEYLGSLPFYSALKERNAAVEMHVFPREQHQLIEPVHRFVNFQRTVEWLRFWLQGAEDPDPSRADQCARWSALRAQAGPAARH
jgi:hypothetical protein